jgi:hypothetical protein
VYEYGGVRAQSGLYHGGFVSYFVATREARVFGGYGGGLTMLRSESSLKIPPCSFVDFLVLEERCWLGGNIGESESRLLLRRRRRCYPRKKERKSRRRPHVQTMYLLPRLQISSPLTGRGREGEK